MSVAGLCEMKIIVFKFTGDICSARMHKTARVMVPLFVRVLAPFRPCCVLSSLAYIVSGTQGARIFRELLNKD